eukprot:4626585-Alexandrium_andersonii.AAC.1
MTHEHTHDRPLRDRVFQNSVSPEPLAAPSTGVRTPTGRQYEHVVYVGATRIKSVRRPYDYGPVALQRLSAPNCC